VVRCEAFAQAMCIQFNSWICMITVCALKAENYSMLGPQCSKLGGHSQKENLTCLGRPTGRVRVPSYWWILIQGLKWWNECGKAKSFFPCRSSMFARGLDVRQRPVEEAAACNAFAIQNPEERMLGWRCVQSLA
jgi:hypothetical protein